VRLLLNVLPPTCVPQCGHLAYILKAHCPHAAQAAASAAARPLLVVGSINMDLVLSVERLPAAGETLSARTLQTFPGGKARAAAAALPCVAQCCLVPQYECSTSTPCP